MAALRLETVMFPSFNVPDRLVNAIGALALLEKMAR